MRRSRVLPCLVSAMLLCGLLLTGCDSFQIRVAKAETAEFTSDEAISGIYVNTTASDVILKPSEDGVLRVVSREADLYRHNIQIRDNVLYVEKQSDPSFGIQLNNIVLEITVYLPKTAYDRLHLHTSSGDIRIPGWLSFREISLESSSGSIESLAHASEVFSSRSSSGSQHLEGTFDSDLTAESSSGNITLSAVFGKNASVKASSGTLDLDHTVLTGKLELQTSSGDIRFEQCDAADIRIKASSGDVRGSLLSEKNFSTHTSSGSVSVPDPVSGAGPCDIRTSSGDIHITVEPGIV